MIVHFQKSTAVHQCMALLQAVLVSVPPHKFIRPPLWYCQLQKIRKYDFRVCPNGIFISSFIEIHPAVGVNHADGQTDMAT
jgi:hypothetical protein